MNFLFKLYNHKLFPRIFYKKPDGGKNSGVTGYFLIEWKILFSIGLLRFSHSDRDVYHKHAFDAVTFWLKGSVYESDISGKFKIFKGPSIIPKLTPRSKCHRVLTDEVVWALTFRGPWNNNWKEVNKQTKKETTLTHGRKIVKEEEYNV